MITGLTSFIIGCSILLGITILITTQWYKHKNNKSKFDTKGIISINWDNMNKPTKEQQHSADVIHNYIDKHINK